MQRRWKEKVKLMPYMGLGHLVMMQWAYHSLIVLTEMKVELNSVRTWTHTFVHTALCVGHECSGRCSVALPFVFRMFVNIGCVVV